MPLSPAAAAKIAGVSRSLISKEIKSGVLPATLKNNGHHAIERPDLDAWMSRRTERSAAPEPPATRHEPPIDEVLRQELTMMREAYARLEGKHEATAARLDDLAKDRDAWRAQAEQLASDAKAAQLSLWSRIFGTR